MDREKSLLSKSPILPNVPLLLPQRSFASRGRFDAAWHNADVKSTDRAGKRGASHLNSAGRER